MYYYEFDSQQGSFSIGDTLWGANNSESGEIALVVQRGGSGALFFSNVVSFDNNEIIHINSLSSELLLNWDFSTWVGDDPSSWTHHASENSSNFVTEVASGARFLSDGSVNLGLKQTGILEENHFYKYELQITDQTSGTIGLWDSFWILKQVGSEAIFSDFFQPNSNDSTFMLLRGVTSGDQTVGYISLKEAETSALSDGSMQQLSDGWMLGINITDAIEICPLWDFSKRDKKDTAESRALAGNLYKSNIGSYKMISFNIDFVSSEHKTFINSWWESGAELFFFITSDSVTEVHSVVLAGNESPINKHQQNTGYFKGAIVLEGF